MCRVAVGLGAHAAALVRVEPEIAHKMLPRVGNVLGELRCLSYSLIIFCNCSISGGRSSCTIFQTMSRLITS